MNSVNMVGRLVGDIEQKENYAMFVLAIPRPFKNEHGYYETDFIDIRVPGNIGKTTKEYCRKGDMLGVKGILRTQNIEIDDLKRKITYVMAEKVTFLSQVRKEDEVYI